LISNDLDNSTSDNMKLENWGVTNFSDDLFRQHGFNEHLVLLTLDEVSKNNGFCRFLLEFPISLVDPSVIMLNQLLYTFYR